MGGVDEMKVEGETLGLGESDPYQGVKGGRENKVDESQVGEMERFRKMGVLKRVKRRPEVVMPLVVAEKGGAWKCKKWKLCVDGRELNKVMVKGRVKMEGLQGGKRGARQKPCSCLSKDNKNTLHTYTLHPNLYHTKI